MKTSANQKPSRKTEDARKRRLQRLVRRRTKALKMALMIIRNDAMVREHDAPHHYRIRLRWCKELETEAGIKEASYDGPADAPELTRSAEGPFAARNG